MEGVIEDLVPKRLEVTTCDETCILLEEMHTYWFTKLDFLIV